MRRRDFLGLLGSAGLFLFFSPDLMPAQGGGEPPIIVVGAVLANAVCDATGARLRHLPMTPGRVKAALAGAGAASVPARA
jgi:hypothetical protein